MKLIALTRGMFAKVDDEDYELLNRHKWYAWKITGTYYAMRTIRRDGVKSIEYMHKRIMKDYPSSVIIDHKDHDGLNNQNENLRPCSRSENNRNRVKGYGASKYIGVSIKKRRSKIYISASINVKGRHEHLGYFKDEISAAKARDIASKKYFGEFASLNFKE